MQLGQPRLEFGPREARVACDVVIAGEPRTWWIAVTGDDIGMLDLGPSAFVPSAVLLAAALGEDLTIEAPMSPLQLLHSHDAIELFGEWWGWSHPLVTAQVAEPPFSTGPEIGLLFTRGIDSMASLISGLDGGAEAATRLIGVDGLEPHHSPTVAAQVWQDTEAAARSVGVPIHRLTTNLRSETERFIRWEYAHGAVLIGASLAMGPLFRSILISSSNNEDYSRPFGSAPDLDVCWSTERTTICHTGQLMTRVQKVGLVASRPELATRLKVCWASDRRRNCGRCTKCMLTMTALSVVGAEYVIDAAFDGPLSLEAIRRLPPLVGAVLAEVVEAIPDDRPDLRSAWLDYMSVQGNHERRGLAGLDPTRRFAEVGLTLRPDERVGWGVDARPMHVRAEARHDLAAAPARVQRPLRWCIAAHATPAAARLAASLTLHCGDGAVILTDALTPGLPPQAVGRLLQSAAVRYWWSDSDHLEGIPLLEAVEHGCVPLQVMSDERADALRRWLPASAGGLVVGMQEIENGLPGDDRLRELWDAALQLIVTGSLERDRLLGSAR
jgi:hypothetical protein